MALSSGTVTIGTTPTAICTMGDGGALICAADSGIFIGGPAVTCSGPAAGVPLPAGLPVFMPGAKARDIPVLGAALDLAVLYGVSADGGQDVSFVSAAPVVSG